jgi:predicted dehydrogenase
MTIDLTDGATINRLRIGLIGYGYWGPNLARVLSRLWSDDVDLVAIADQDATQRMRAGDIFPMLDVVSDGMDLIRDESIDAVVIATPVGSHFHLAAPALKAGKHVFVEKPLAATVFEAEELVSLARREDRVLMVGHVFEYTEAVNYIRNVIDSGELGEILYIRSLRVNLGIYQTDINVLWDLAPHDLSIINYLLDGEPVSVSAVGQAHVTEGVPDIVNLNLSFGEKTLATVVVSWLDPRKIREMTIIGSKKMLVYDDVSSTEKVRIFDKGVDGPGHYESFGEFHYAYRYGDIVSPMLEHSEPLGEEVRHFVDSIRLNKEPRSGGNSGLRVVRALAAAQASLERNGAKISLSDPIVGEVSGRVDGLPVGKGA